MRMTQLLFISLTILLSACGGSSSSGGSDKNALRCVDLSSRGNIVDVGNTCNKNIYVRFFDNNTPSFFVGANSSTPVARSRTSSVYGACFGPFKPRTESGGKFSCKK